MRTTLTLDADVAAGIRAIQEETGATHKAIVNEALRRGLAEMKNPEQPRQRYRTEPHDAGKPAIESVHNVHDLIAFTEGEDFD